MNRYKQPVLTIVIIFATAYILTLIGCAPLNSSSAIVLNPAEASTPTPKVLDQSTNSVAQADPAKISECSADELKSLKTWGSAVDFANARIDKLGKQSEWKNIPDVMKAAASASQVCDASINYYDTKPCRITNKDKATGKADIKVYSAQFIRQQCQKAESYVLEFAPQETSLMVTSAKLLFDTTPLTGISVVSGYSSNAMIGSCFVSNMSKATITYHGEKAVVVDAGRISTDPEAPGYQTFFLVTEEGLKVECFGLDFTGAKTSKNEIAQLLKAKGTVLGLSYLLN